MCVCELSTATQSCIPWAFHHFFFFFFFFFASVYYVHATLTHVYHVQAYRWISINKKYIDVHLLKGKQGDILVILPSPGVIS